MLKIQVILGSVREGRFGTQPATWILDLLKKTEGVEAELIDLKDYPLPFFNEPASPNTSGGVYTNPDGAKFADKIGEADAYVFIVAEYSHGYTAVLKNALDWVYKQWNNKPAAFVSYGGVSAGTRAVQQLRTVLLELQMIPVRNGVHIPAYWEKLNEKGEYPMETLNESGKKLIEQLVWWGKVLQDARKNG